MPFEPGKSGNPNGTGGPKRFQAAVERALAQDDGKRLREAVEKMLDAAAAGEVWAIHFLADRLDGKAAQTVSVVRNATELSDSDLANIAAAGSAGTAEAQGGAEVPSSVH
jgi:hypothetical protein